MCNTDSGFALLTRESLVCHELDDAWQVTSFPNGHQSTCVLEDALKLLANAKCCLFAERPLPPAVFEVQCELALGSDKATKFGPGMAILWSNRTLRVNLRADGRFGVDDGCSSVYGGTILRNDWNHVAIRIENQNRLESFFPHGIGTGSAESFASLPSFTTFPGLVLLHLVAYQRFDMRHSRGVPQRQG